MKKTPEGPFCIGFDLAGYGADRNCAVVVSGTKEKAILAECVQTMQHEPFDAVVRWIGMLIERYPDCRAASWKDPVSTPALEMARFGALWDTRVKLYTPTRNEKERLAWQVRMMCEYGRIDLTELPVSHQIANAIAIDILPPGKRPYRIPGVGSTGLDDGPYLPGKAPRKKAAQKTPEEWEAIRQKAWATRRAAHQPEDPE